MSKPVRPGYWDGSMVILDSIPIVCPECNHQVTLRGSLSEDGERFEVTKCPHCGVKMELSISAGGNEEDAEEEQVNPLEKMEVSIGVKNLPNIPECLYRVANMESVSGCIDRVVSILCTIFANYEMNPNAIKNMYIREAISSIYTPEGKRNLVAELEAQIEKSENTPGSC